MLELAGSKGEGGTGGWEKQGNVAKVGAKVSDKGEAGQGHAERLGRQGEPRWVGTGEEGGCHG